MQCITRVKDLTKTLRKTCNTAMPLRKKSARKVPWWDSRLTAAKKESYKARRAFQREKDAIKRLALKRRYREELRKYSGLINANKRQKWEEYVTHTSSENPWSFAYKLQTGKLRLRVAASNIFSNGQHTMSWESTANAMLEQLFPSNNEKGDFPQHSEIRKAALSPPERGDTELFTLKEMREALAKMKSRKAPGPDNFDHEIMKTAMPIFEQDLLNIYNACLRQSVFPNEWKVGRVIAIRKGEEKIATDPRSYRPICLLPFLSKLFEALILKKLNTVTEGKLSPRQCGFSSGKTPKSDCLVRFSCRR